MGARKLATVIKVELTLVDWREVIAALHNRSADRMNDAAMTNNERHAMAWERESHWLERLAFDIEGAIGDTNTQHIDSSDEGARSIMRSDRMNEQAMDED